MRVIETDSQYSLKKLLTTTAFIIGIYLVLYLIFSFFSQEKWVRSPFFFVAALLVVVHFLREAGTDRIFKVSFDEAQQQIIFSSKLLFYKPHFKFYALADLQLEVDELKGKNGVSPLPHALYFMKNKEQVAVVNKYKDRYLPQTLELIRKAAADYHLPIKVI